MLFVSQKFKFANNYSVYCEKYYYTLAALFLLVGRPETPTTISRVDIVKNSTYTNVFDDINWPKKVHIEDDSLIHASGKICKKKLFNGDVNMTPPHD